MTPTPEQSLILSTPVEPSSCLKTIAYAGTGKTSTLVALATQYHPEELLYLAFNKSVEQDAVMKFPANTTVKTVHALAYHHVGSRYRGNLGNLQSWQISKFFSVPNYHATLIRRSLESWLNSDKEQMDRDLVEPDILKRYRETLYEEEIILYVNQLWEAMVHTRNQMPMTHSGYLKLFQLEKKNLGFAVVLLDEAQDTNPATLDIVLNQAKHGSRVYLVGDPYQQIYSWRGAIDAMNTIDCPSLRLTQSFRFGQPIAAAASHMLLKMFREKTPLLGTNETAVVGRLSDGPATILARTNAGLVTEAYHAAMGGRSVHVIGDKQFLEALDQMTDIFHLWSKKSGLIKDNRVSKHKSFEALKLFSEESFDAEMLSRTRVIEAFTNNWPEVQKMILSKLTTMGEANRILSTCHKAKGLEWDRVRLADDFKEPCQYLAEDGKWTTKLLSKTQQGDGFIHPEEINLLYVAATRAKKELQPSTGLAKLLSLV